MRVLAALRRQALHRLMPRIHRTPDPEPEHVEGDGPGHELTIDCPCIPTIELVVDDNGQASEHVIHNPWTEKYR